MKKEAAYKFVTREVVEVAFLYDLKMGIADKMLPIIDHLLAERDAYRQVAIIHYEGPASNPEKYFDAEAAKILEGKGSNPF